MTAFLFVKVTVSFIERPLVFWEVCTSILLIFSLFVEMLNSICSLKQFFWCIFRSVVFFPFFRAFIF